MVRSLGIVLAGVILLWFFARVPQAEMAIRAVDTSPPISGFLAAAPGAPVPTDVPGGYTPTSATGEAGTLRIGYVTPEGEYAEYAASTAPRDMFLDDITGSGAPVGEVEVAGSTWEQWAGRDDTTSLVRQVGETTVVIGGERETATFGEVRDLAVTVR